LSRDYILFIKTEYLIKCAYAGFILYIKDS